MKRKLVMVVPNSQSEKQNWDVKIGGKQKPLETLENKKEAIELAKEIAKGGPPSQVQVRDILGRIQYENTYQGDPEKYRS